MIEQVPAAGHPQPAEQVRRTAIAMAALAQTGLFYAVNDYDTDRYRKLAALAAELLAAVTDDPAAHWDLELGRETGYATPKIDVRGALVDDRERILLMRERSDNRWSSIIGLARAAPSARTSSRKPNRMAIRCLRQQRHRK